MTAQELADAAETSRGCWRLSRRHAGIERKLLGDAAKAIDALLLTAVPTADPANPAEKPDVTPSGAFAWLDRMGFKLNGGQQKRRAKLLGS